MLAQHIHMSQFLSTTHLVHAKFFSNFVAFLNSFLPYLLHAGPDAVKFVVNHAEIKAIFCVPQTLNTVSLILINQGCSYFACSQQMDIVRGNFQIISNRHSYEKICAISFPMSRLHFLEDKY